MDYIVGQPRRAKLDASLVDAHGVLRCAAWLGPGLLVNHSSNRRSSYRHLIIAFKGPVIKAFG